ncbi:MAG TPA: hypothetical protein VL986_08950 [Terracidiphilus sp.]|nr:hypothetical protein [Terracidiphilus sp.]
MPMLLCNSKSAVERRYVNRMWIAAGLCVLNSSTVAITLRLTHWKGLPVYPLAVLPALPILWALYETGRYLNDEKDEFLRNVLIQSMLGGIGGCLGLTTVWGYLQDFAGIHSLDPIWVYPIFWLCAALSYPVVKARYR